MRPNELFLILAVCPAVSAHDDDIPAWEIALAAGSGAVALLLCMFAVYSYHERQRVNASRDVESGVRVVPTMSSGVRVVAGTPL